MYKSVGFDDERRRSVHNRYDSWKPAQDARRDTDRDRSRDRDRKPSRRDSDLAFRTSVGTRSSKEADKENDRRQEPRVAAQLPAKPPAPASASAGSTPPASPSLKARNPNVQETFERWRRYGELVEKRGELKRQRDKKKMEMEVRERDFVPYRDPSRGAAFPSIVEWHQRTKLADEKEIAGISNRLKSVNQEWQQCLDSIATEMHGRGSSTSAAALGSQKFSLSDIEAKFAEFDRFRQKIQELEAGRLESDIALAETQKRCSALESQQTHLIEENSSLKTIITGLQDDLVALKGGTDQAQHGIEELRSKVDSIQSHMTELRSNVPDNIMDISQQFGSCVDELSSQRGKVQKIGEDIKAQMDQQTSLTIVVNQLKTNVSSTQDQIKMIDLPVLTDITKAWTKESVYSKVKYHHSQLEIQRDELQSIQNDLQALKENSGGPSAPQASNANSSHTDELSEFSNALQQLQVAQARAEANETKLEETLSKVEATQSKQYETLKKLLDAMGDACSEMIDGMDHRVKELEAAQPRVDASRTPAATPELEARIVSLESKANTKPMEARDQQLAARIHALEDLKLGDTISHLRQQAAAHSNSSNANFVSIDANQRLLKQQLQDLSQRIEVQTFRIQVVDQQLSHINTKELADIAILQLDQFHSRLGPRIDTLAATDRDLQIKLGTLQGDYAKLKEDFRTAIHAVQAVAPQKRPASPLERRDDGAKRQRAETNGRQTPNGRSTPQVVPRPDRTVADG